MVLDQDGIAAIVGRLADEIATRHGPELIVVSVLKGSLIFASDLIRAMPVHPLIDFIAISPYVSGERVRVVKDIGIDIEDAPVVLVHDVIDTGLSSSFILGELARYGPRSLSVCTLIDKPARRLVPVEIDHRGLEVDDDFLIGYGLDFAGRYRNLNVIAAADIARLSHDPDCYQRWAHPLGHGRG